MSNYIFILIWIGVMAVLANQNYFKRSELVCGVQEERFQPWFAVLVFLPIIIWAGLRSGKGYIDTNAYISSYNNIPNTVKKLLPYLSTVEKDKGFTLFGGIIKIIFGSHYTPYLFIIAMIQGLIIVFFYRKYSNNYLLSIFLFVATGEYFAWMFNGIRQFLAVTIIVAATPLLLKKKYISLIIIILLASTIHQTALIMIPIIFIVQGETWNKKTLLCIGGAIVILFAVDAFTNLLDSALVNTQYAETVSTWKTEGDDGVNPIRVIVYAIPAIIAFGGRKQLKQDKNPIIDISVNMSIISVAIYTIGSVTSGIMIGRLPIYVSLYSYILLPYEIDRVFTRESAKMLKVALVVCYLAYYYYTMHFAYGRI